MLQIDWNKIEANRELARCELETIQFLSLEEINDRFGDVFAWGKETKRLYDLVVLGYGEWITEEMPRI